MATHPHRGEEKGEGKIFNDSRESTWADTGHTPKDLDLLFGIRVKHPRDPFSDKQSS